ncbi:MAG: hypothetical protein V2A61_03880, partial [Calditrichota bacterium]
MDPNQQLAELLIRQNAVDPADLERAQAEAVKRRIPLREALIGMDICLEDQINWAVSRDLNIPFVILTDEMIDREMLADFPLDFLRATRAFPIPDALGGVTLVMGDALDVDNFERARRYCHCELQRAVGPMGRIMSLLNQLTPREPIGPTGETIQSQTQERREGRIDTGGVAAAYRMLVDARKRFACRILLRPAGDGLEAAFKLERGWILYRAWSRQEALAVMTRCRIMAGLSTKPTADREQAWLVTRIKGERIRFNFDFLRLAEGETLNISVTPLYHCVPFTQIETLSEEHRKALTDLFSARRPTGVILVNASDERQRHRMVYGILSALFPQNYQILSMEREQYFDCSQIYRIQLLNEPSDALRQSSHKTDIIAVPSAPPWFFREFFQYGGD